MKGGRSSQRASQKDTARGNKRPHKVKTEDDEKEEEFHEEQVELDKKKQSGEGGGGGVIETDSFRRSEMFAFYLMAC